MFRLFGNTHQRFTSKTTQTTKLQKTLMATFLLADNQDITRFGFHYLLDGITDRTEAIETIDIRTRSELLRHIQEHEDAIVVLDYSLFDIYSIEELLNIAGRFPSVHWIMFSEDLSESFVRRLVLEQNFSILLKESNQQEMLMAVRYNIKGERFLCQSITNLLFSAPARKDDIRERLTATEVEVLKLIAQGKSVKEIAAERVSSIHTITTHKKNIFRKLEVNTIYEATKYALRAGLVEMADYYI